MKKEDIIFDLEDNIIQLREKLNQIEWIASFLFNRHSFGIIPNLDSTSTQTFENAVIYVSQYEECRIPITLLLDVVFEARGQYEVLSEKYYELSNLE